MKNGFQSVICRKVAYLISIFVVALISVLPLTASANYICPNGPGPGERQVGRTGGGGGIAPVPVCVRDGPVGPYAQPRPAAPPPDSYVAVAWHRDAGDVWAVWNQRTDEAAKGAALEACNGVMGGGCTIAQAGSNSSVAIARTPDGSLYSAWGATPSAARAQVLQQCAKAEATCDIAHVFTATAGAGRSLLAQAFGAGRYFPDASVARYHYVMIAWPKLLPPPQWQKKAWLVSGVQGFDATQRLALERCRQDTRMECIVSEWAVNNGLVVRYRSKVGSEYWINAASLDHARERVEKSCVRVQGGTCAIVATYDGRTPRQDVVESLGEVVERREGFFAVAWAGGAKPSWRNAVLSAGHASWQEAKTAALSRCEANSGVACILLVDEEDNRIFPWLAIYRDGKGQVQWGMHNTLEQIHTMMISDCASCRRIASFDLRKPGTAMHSIAD